MKGGKTMTLATSEQVLPAVSVTKIG